MKIVIKVNRSSYESDEVSELSFTVKEFKEYLSRFNDNDVVIMKDDILYGGINDTVIKIED